jgi:hypothetical protein
MASAGFEPANLGTKGQHATPRPPKPLMLVSCRNKKCLHFESRIFMKYIYISIRVRDLILLIFILMLLIILNRLVCGRTANIVITQRAADRILWFESRSG